MGLLNGGSSDDIQRIHDREAWRTLLPAQIGLTLSSASLMVLAGAHASSPASAVGLDWLMGSIPILFLALIAKRTGRLPQDAVSGITFFSAHLSGVSGLILGLFSITQNPLPPSIEALLRVLSIVGTTCLSFYWLRELRGTPAIEMAFVAFCSISVAQVLIFVLSFIGPALPLVIFVCSFLQFFKIRSAESQDVPRHAFVAVSEAYFGTSRRCFSSRRYLVTAAFGICLIAISAGMGAFIPIGLMGSSPLAGRLLTLLITLIVGLGLGFFARLRPATSPTLRIWISLETLIAGGALLTTTPWPLPLLGNAMSVAGAILLHAFVWYLIVAFISFGSRDSFVYAGCCWISCTLLENVGAWLTLSFTSESHGTPPTILCLIFLFLLVATQVILSQLLGDPARYRRSPSEAPSDADDGLPLQSSFSADDSELADSDDDHGPSPSLEDIRRFPFVGVLADINPKMKAPEASSGTSAQATTPDVHIATSVLAMGQRFGLTGREVEVLTLYALGHTQARVSEELSLSTNTVHTHIKRIYDKTNLHSRQEILDFIAEYGG